MTTVTETQTPVVHVDNVVAGYLPGVNILNGCSLVAHQGELIGIIGPNGAGKSTLLKAIFGQVHVRSGRISLKGDDITGLKANKLVADQPVMSARHTLRAPMSQRTGDREVIRVRPFVRLASNLSLTTGVYAANIPPFNPLRLFAEGAPGSEPSRPRTCRMPTSPSSSAISAT